MRILFVGGPYDGNGVDFTDYKPAQIHLMLGDCSQKFEGEDARKALQDHVGKFGKSAELAILQDARYLIAIYALEGSDQLGWKYRYAGWSLSGAPSSTGSG